MTGGDGAPLSDATARWTEWKGGRSERSASADADGRMVVRLSTRRVQLHVQAPGFESRRVWAAPEGAAPDDPLEVVLPLGSAVAGRVVWDDGAPAAGATVRFAPDDSIGSLLSPNLGPRDPLVTDAEGRFRTDALPADRLVVAVVETDAGTDHRWIETGPADRDADEEVTLTLPRRVRAVIRIEPPEDPEVEGRVRFDPDDAETMGVVSLDVPPWSAVVEGLARGVRHRVTFTPQDGSGRLEVTPDLVVTADGQELDLVLPATPAEAGPSDAGEPFSFGWRVVDVHGDPISPEQWLRAGLEVEPVVGMIAPDGSRFGSRTDITSVETHVGGDAVVRTFGPPFTAALFAGGREQARAEITESTGEVEFRVDLARRPADGRLEFHAFDPAGSPTMAQVRVLSLDAHHRAETWTVFEGRATLVLPPGAYVWEAETQLREFGIDARARGRVAATAGADVDVPIRFAAPGGVEVRIPPGIDARATDVSIASPASIHPIAHLAPSPDGTFRSHGLAPGDVRVVVSTRRGAPPLESVFPVPARIDSGTITRVDVPPAPETRRVRVELAGPEHAFVSAYSSPDELLFTLVVGSGADLLVPRRSARWRAWPAWVHDPSGPFSMDHVAGQAVGGVASEGGDGTTTLRFEWN